MTNAERAELARLRQLEAQEIHVSTASLWATRAAEAWNAVRKPGDNDWNNLPMEMRHKLVDLAEKALRGRAEQEGDYAPEGFFDKVRELGGVEFAAAAGLPSRSGPHDDDLAIFAPGFAAPSDPPTFGERTKDFFADPFGFGQAKSFDGDNRRVGVAERRLEDLIPETEKRSGLVDRREVVSETAAPPKAELKGALPEGFPARAELAAVGVSTYHQLRKRIEAGTLTEIPGIKDATAIKIAERLEPSI